MHSRYDRELDVMRRLGREASEVVMAVYATDFAVEMKGKDDPVTLADKQANTLICAALAQAFPEHGVLAEESAPKTEGERAAIALKERLFLVDPVDGTREFTEKNGQFCVMIGLVDGPSAVAGVVAVPCENKLLWGSSDGGTFVEPLDGTGSPERLNVSRASAGLRAVVSRSHPAPRTRAVLEALGVEQTIPCGSVGLKVARVIEGAAEIYVHPSRGASLWDACAPDALLRGAGGVMTALGGDPIDYRGPLSIESGLIATTPALLPRVLGALELTRPR
ncbi:MAG: 3'(2'),5'-bisphosphate nucleotidase CysQ [Polyangiaceae bacterium]|jgi:3'(2'), 5'-bisphosphate nucleotidase|nr:3'(2'),5'-bisphosphate nucleotidase CysQ [Polyangiaceae bacterium]MBK8939382.1 3'(2'),5'-bisphosphate nucleotidase CysQ [Polyangiaceae bacterium]